MTIIVGDRVTMGVGVALDGMPMQGDTAQVKQLAGDFARCKWPQGYATWERLTDLTKVVEAPWHTPKPT